MPCSPRILVLFAALIALVAVVNPAPTSASVEPAAATFSPADAPTD